MLVKVCRTSKPTFVSNRWKDGHRLATHLRVLSPASCWLQGVRSLDNLFRRGGGFVRGVVWTLLDHILTLLALWCGRAGAFTQDWRAGRCALVWVTGSAKREGTQRERELQIHMHSKLCLFLQKNLKILYNVVLNQRNYRNTSWI